MQVPDREYFPCYPSGSCTLIGVPHDQGCPPDTLLRNLLTNCPAIPLGFCGETEEEHEATVDLMRSVGFDAAFMFAYSDREKTYAAKHLQVDGSQEGGRQQVASQQQWKAILRPHIFCKSEV